eukprot:13641954-Alexandrium_andersonii.AAC.1
MRTCLNTPQDFAAAIVDGLKLPRPRGAGLDVRVLPGLMRDWKSFLDPLLVSISGYAGGGQQAAH